MKEEKVENLKQEEIDRTTKFPSILKSAVSLSVRPRL
jgi:hypothetical protein